MNISISKTSVWLGLALFWTLLFLACSGSFAQTAWTNVGTTLQQKVNGTDTLYRIIKSNSMYGAPFKIAYGATKNQLDAFLLARPNHTGTQPISTVASLQTELDLKIPLTQKASINGVATLDGSGKIPLSQINDALLGAVNYKGAYNVATNTPTLPTAATSNKGWYYKVSDIKTVFQGDSVFTGDWIISNGVVWDSFAQNRPETDPIYNAQKSTLAKTDGSNATGEWNISITGTSPWVNVLGKPTTISGYGITNAYTKTESDAKLASGQTIGANTTGNSGTTTGWGGWTANFSGTGSDPTYMIGAESGVVKAYTPAQFQTKLNVNNGATLNNNVLLWNGNTINKGATYDTGLYYLSGFDYAAASTEQRLYTQTAVRSWLGSPSGGETLPSVMARGNTTPYDLNIIKPTGNPLLSIENGSGGSFPLFQLKDNRSGGNNWNIENGRTLGKWGLYNATLGSDAITVDNNNNVGIGTTSPKNKFVTSNSGANGLEINPTVGGGSSTTILNYNRAASAYTPLSFEAASYNFGIGNSTFSGNITAPTFTGVASNIAIIPYSGAGTYPLVWSNGNTALSTGTVTITPSTGTITATTVSSVQDVSGIARSISLSNGNTSSGSGTSIYMGYDAVGGDPYGIRLLQTGNPSSTKTGSFAIQRKGTGVGDSDWISVMSTDFSGNTSFAAGVTATSYTGGAVLTGTPTAPTATAGTNTTQVATTAFVQSAVASSGLSGTYTPTISSTSNIASNTVNEFRYMRIGNIVQVTGSISATPTVGGDVTFKITLPIPSAFTSSLDLNGIVSSNSTSGGSGTNQLIGQTSTNLATCTVNLLSLGLITLVYNYIVR